MIESIDSLQCLRAILGGLGGGGIVRLEQHQAADCFVGGIDE